MSKRQLSLNFFIYPDGHHEAAWRHKASTTDRILDVTYYQELAQRAEAHKFDAVFFADGPALADNVRYAQRFRLEPITLLAAIASATKRIGLIATASTTYTEPYNLARLFASLDHISGGRAGWNIVTTSSPQAAQNFGLPEHPPHNERYERAREYLDVITRLWDSWEDDPLVNNPVSGIFADTSKIHTIDHIGKHFRVRGPLNVSRPPQGRPVYVQAGSSEDGRAFAARFAEAIFTAHQTLASAQEFYADIKGQARALDRSPDQIKILPGISPFIASTQTEADRLQEELDALIQPEFSLTQLRQMTGLDLTGFDLDSPFPRHLIDIKARMAWRAALSSSSTSLIARSRRSASSCSGSLARAAIG
ncbi:FMN-dependent oxidoreductase (nitrilotriacetate monooxygenase family) [Bradyrhizobium sp. USDA 3397]